MASTIIIICPQCEKQSKAPDTVRGKKIRCRECGYIFGVPGPAGDKSGAAGTGSAAPEKVQVQSIAQQMAAEFHEDSNPYDLTNLDLTPHCPHCAGDMDEEDVICLHCGYNTRTREIALVVRVMGPTFFERLLWLLPAIICVLAVIGLALLIIYLWTWLPGNAKKQPESWLWWFFDNFPTQVYGTVFSAFAIWLAGKFAFKRIVLHPTPPEKVKR